MTAVPLGEARNRLSEYVAEIQSTHERVTITRHGHPAAVLISADDLEALEETLDIIATPGALDGIREGLRDLGGDHVADNKAIRAKYGLT